MMLASTIHISNNNPTPPTTSPQAGTGMAGTKPPSPHTHEPPVNDQDPRGREEETPADAGEASEPQQCAPTPHTHKGVRHGGRRRRNFH